MTPPSPEPNPRPLPRILVVDDEPSNFDAIQMILAGSYSLDYSMDAEKLDQKLSKTRYDAILLDIMMPLTDGISALNALRSNRNTIRIPVIMVTALTDPQALTRAFEIGCNDYVTKPLKAHELRARLQHHIRMSEIASGDLKTVQESKGQVLALRDGIRELRGATFQSQFFAAPLKRVASLLHHELNTPLNGILGSITVIQDAMVTKELDQVHEFLSYVHTSSKRLNRAIQKLLRFIDLATQTKKTQSWPSNQSKKVTLNAKALISQLSELSERTDLEHRLRVDFESICFPIDLTDAIFILNELVDNSLRHSNPDSLVRLYTNRSQDRFLEIILENEGSFPQSTIDKITPFQQPDRASREEQGLGLGLHLTKTILEANHSKLELSNLPNNTARTSMIFDLLLT